MERRKSSFVWKEKIKGNKEKISHSRKGRGLWLGEKRNLPTGVSHHNWLGGKSSLADKLRKSYRYTEIWRKGVFERDNYICQKCGQKGGKLEAHHVIEFAFLIFKYNINSLDDAYNCPFLWDLNNGQTLCCKCHNLTKNGRRKK